MSNCHNSLVSTAEGLIDDTSIVLVNDALDLRVGSGHNLAAIRRQGLCSESSYKACFVLVNSQEPVDHHEHMTSPDELLEEGAFAIFGAKVVEP